MALDPLSNPRIVGLSRIPAFSVNVQRSGGREKSDVFLSYNLSKNKTSHFIQFANVLIRMFAWQSPMICKCSKESRID